MARIPDDEIERLKREVSVERLAEARGVSLRRHGKDLLGLCPFHDDHEPSLVISPEKNLWHCLGACQTGGTCIDWVMKVEGVSFRHAVELLRSDAYEGSGGNGTARPPRASLVRKLPCSLAGEADDRELLRQVVAFYHETLKGSPEALAYLEKRGLRSEEMISRFHLGYANRTLGYRLPAKTWKEGAEMRGRLERLGILRKSGHEHFRGSLVIPVIDAEGAVTEVYGRKIGDTLRNGTPLHLYLPGPHRGVWNAEALAASEEVILCESLIDALTFWCAGYRHVTASYGVEGFTEEHLGAFRAAGVRRVLIAYDRDEAGERAAERLAERLRGEGFDGYRVQFPRGMDANEYALKVTPASGSLGIVLRRAVWIGKGKEPAGQRGPGERASPLAPPAAPEAPPAGGEAPPAGEEAVQGDEALQAPAGPEGATAPSREPPTPEPAMAAHAEAPPPAPPGGAAKGEEGGQPGEGSPPLAAEPSPPPASPLPPAPRPDVDAEVTGEEAVLRLGDRRYRVRGLARNLSFDSLRVNVLAARGDAFYVDTIDLYAAKQRAAYVKAAAEELGIEERVVKRDLGRVLLKLEQVQEEQIQAALAPKERAVTLTDEEQREALALLEAPDLLDRLLADFERCGVVGEETNKLVGYLAAVSRKLAEPLAVIIQSSSAAGKTSLMEAVLALVPEEDRVKYSAMTGQSLFYMSGTDLRHRVLAIVEEEGAERASYALKLLQSEGELTIASTGKDPQTGRLVTQEYRVEGPVAIFLSTTAIEIDEELQNRAIVLTVDEEREQTRAIHRLQRERRTLRGLLSRQDRERILALHRNAQRLLSSVPVVNPYAPRLTFLDSRTRTRRDHEKYLTLIEAAALLHQYQRPRKTVTHEGRKVEYIEATLDDIALATRLADEVLGRSLDDLPPQTRRFLALLEGMVAGACERDGVEREDYHFTRRMVTEATGWSYRQVQVHLGRLEDLEYVLAHRQGPRMLYELLYDGRGKDSAPFLMGLVDVEALRSSSTAADLTARGADLTGDEGAFDTPSTPDVPPLHRHFTGADIAPERRQDAASRPPLTGAPGTTARGRRARAPSYVGEGHTPGGAE